MNAQISQTEKTQGPFIMYERVLFIRGKSQEIDRKMQENVACKPVSAFGRSRVGSHVCKWLI